MFQEKIFRKFQMWALRIDPEITDGSIGDSIGRTFPFMRSVCIWSSAFTFNINLFKYNFQP